VRVREERTERWKEKVRKREFICKDSTSESKIIVLTARRREREREGGGEREGGRERERKRERVINLLVKDDSM